MIKAVAFDFDGTMVDSARIIWEMFRNLAKKHKKRFNVPLKGFKEWFDSTWENNFYKMGFSKKEVREIIKKREITSDYSKVRLFSGIGLVVKKLKKKNLKLYVFSTTEKEKIKKVLRKFGLLKCFEDIFSTELKYSDKKRLLRNLLRKYKLNKKEVVVVGDTKEDIISAKKNGLKVVSVSYGWNPKYLLKKHKPNVLVDKAPQITKAVERFL